MACTIERKCENGTELKDWRTVLDRYEEYIDWLASTARISSSQHLQYGRWLEWRRSRPYFPWHCSRPAYRMAMRAHALAFAAHEEGVITDQAYESVAGAVFAYTLNVGCPRDVPGVQGLSRERALEQVRTYLTLLARDGT